jgi:hypothetical protein
MEHTRIHKLASSASDQKETNASSVERKSKVGGFSPHTRSSVREPVNELENAMDIAMGSEGECWERRRSTSKDKKAA